MISSCDNEDGKGDKQGTCQRVDNTRADTEGEKYLFNSEVEQVDTKGEWCHKFDKCGEGLFGEQGSVQ